MKLQAEWTPDCSGKKDYDGNILAISTRYWPAGGGYMIVRNIDGVVSVEDSNDGTPCSAHSSLIIWHEVENYTTLAEEKFEGDTFPEVAAKVETWAQEQMDRAVRVLLAEFGVPAEVDE